MSLFNIGQLCMTAGVDNRMTQEEEFETFVLECIKKHAIGDWGLLDDHDKKENELSLKEGFRLLSSYKYKNGTKIWIITEADRSSTTILFPDEY